MQATGKIRQSKSGRWILESTLWPWPVLLGTYTTKHGAKQAAKRRGISLENRDRR